MKLLSLNINFQSKDKFKVVDLILKEDPDIVCLQEVTHALDSNVYKQYKAKEVIDTNLDVVYRFKFFGPNYETYPYVFPLGGKVELGGLVQSGNYILSKYKFISTENIMYWRNYSQIRDWSNWLEEDHPRGMQKVVLDVNGKLLTIFNNHGIYSKNRVGDERTDHECKFINDLVKEESNDFILAGDFNLLPDSDSLKILKENFKEIVTGKGIKSTLVNEDKVIDYLFHSDDVKILNLELIKDEEVSDHYPIIIEFDI